MFYKIDSSKITLREFWFETKLFAWVGLLVKLFKIHLRGSTDDLAVDAVGPFRTDASRIAPATLSRFEPTLKTLAGLGFGTPLWYDLEDVYQATRNTIAVLRHTSGRAWARVQCRTNFGRVPAKTKFFLTFVSPVAGGYVVTGNGKYDMAWPKFHDVLRHRKMAAEQVWAAHQDRMTAAVQTVGADELAFADEDYHRSLFDYHVGRGVFVPLDGEEFVTHSTPPAPPVAAGEAFATAAPPTTTPTMSSGVVPPPLPYEPTAAAATAVLATEPDLLERATLDELRRLQTRKVNWASFVLLLGLSGGLFVLQSRHADAGQGWQDVAILVGVLLLHESGHYLAMKLFGYRNLRMFFIPGLGAAVSGRHYNAPAWKKIVVSLMGPLPGIVVGTGLIVAYGFTRDDLLYRIGWMAVIINALNLIPILPLDGGWVAHAAIFARRPWADVGFRVVAAVLLVTAGAFVPGLNFLTYVAIATLLALPLAYTIAMTVGELRGVPGLGVSPDSQSIPPDTARVILAKLRGRIKRNLNVKAAALHVTSVFESLNARPPSAGATLGLLTLHVGGFALGFVALVAAVVLHNPDLLRRGAMAKWEAAHPATPVTAADVAALSGWPAEASNTMVAQFKDEAAARAAAVALGPGRPVARLGPVLLAGFTPAKAADQKAAFARLEKTAADVYVESNAMRSDVEVSFKLPDTAAGKRAFEELDLYLADAHWNAAPPWADEADWPAAKRAEQTGLRRMVRDLQNGPTQDLKQVQQSFKQITEAERRGDTAEAERLQAEAKAAREKAAAAARERLKTQYGRPDLVDAWTADQQVKDFEQREARIKQDVLPALGLWPAGRPTNELAQSGFAMDAPEFGKRVDCRFVRTPAGLAAVVRWLYAQGATDVRCRITGGKAFDTDFDPDD